MKPTLFYHIPKTGGSSFADEVRLAFGPDGNANWSQSLKHDSPAELISGHLPAHFFYPWLDLRYSFTILRDPVDRVWSMCRYKEDRIGNRNGSHATADFFLYDDEYLSSRRQLWNRMTTQLGGDFYDLQDDHDADMEPILESALALLGKLDAVFLLKDWDETQKTLWDDVGLPYAGPYRHNVSNVNELTDERRERCMELTEWDRKLYHAVLESGMAVSP